MTAESSRYLATYVILFLQHVSRRNSVAETSVNGIL
jgi:hypothetical protein